ncbi:MAG: pilin [Elusimicrobiaceae bacterium]|nr:pilin [Elusimicrobiaceae bacterium]
MKKRGFTLIELLTVIMVIAVLTAVGLPQYRKVIEKGRVTEAVAMLRTIYDSSDRLAGEFGVIVLPGADAYSALLAAKGMANEPSYSFARLDMFDASNLPKGCSLQDNGTTLQCSRFSYKIAKDGYVAAKKLSTPYADTYILLDRSTLDLYCQPAAADTEGEACDTFGLTPVSAGVSF